MRLKIPVSHVIGKVLKKCLNARERAGTVKKNRDCLLPFPTVLWIVSVCEKNPDRKIVIEISFLGDRRVDGTSGVCRGE